MNSMNRNIGLLTLCLVAGGVLVAGSRGTVPRSEAARYAAHGRAGGVAIGATQLSAEQVRRDFSSDVSRCCVVVEVALYPAAGAALDVDLADFALRSGASDVAVRPSDAGVIAGRILKSAPSQREVAVYPQVGIGYESGPRVRDPVTGEIRGGGVRTSAGVGVGVGETRPGSTDRDREVMQLELEEKGLPQGNAAKAVAGHLYFHLPSRRKNATYQLEYEHAGSKAVLRLP